MSGGEDEESVFWPTNKRGYELLSLVGEVRATDGCPPTPLHSLAELLRPRG